MPVLRYLVTVCILFASCNAQTDLECGPLIEDADCGFYDCVEEVVPCGPIGYAMGAGKPFCMQIENNMKKLNSDGKQWAEGMMQCQMMAVAPLYANNASCEEINEAAGNAFSGCYCGDNDEYCQVATTGKRKHKGAVARINSITSFFNDILKLLQDLLKCLIDEIKKLIEKCLKEIISYIKKRIKQYFKNFWNDSIEQVIEDIIEFIKEKAKEMIEKILEIIKKKLIKLIEDIIEKIKDIINSCFDSFIEYIKDLLERIWGQIDIKRRECEADVNPVGGK